MNEEVQANKGEQLEEKTPVTETTPPPVPGQKQKTGGRKKALTCVLWFLLIVAAGVAFINREHLMSFWTPPLAGPYQITAAIYKGSGITKEGATFEARFKIKIVQIEGWKKIELLPSTVAIVKAELPAGSYLVLSGGKYAMLTRKSGDIEASITCSVAVREGEGSHMLEFPRVASVTCMLDALFSDANIDVVVGGAQSVETVKTNGTTHVTAALPDNTTVKLSWKKALPKLAEGPSRYHCETKTLISIGEGLILGQTRMDFSILHTPSHALELKVPAGVSVLEVTGKDVRDWRIVDGKMTVQLEKEVIGPYALSIKYEAPFMLSAGKIVVPMITGSGMESEKGSIGVAAMANIEIRNGKVVNAHVIDAKDLPAEIVSMTPQPVLLAYRYSTPSFEVNLDVGKPGDAGVLLTLIDRAGVTIVQTLDGKRITRAIYNVRNNRNQFLRLELPKGAELWSASVGGRAAQASKDEKGRILLPLVRSQGGAGMSAFPVEIVYAEEGTKPDESGRGTAKVDLPVCSEPIMYLTVSLYAPQQGKYWEFDGTMKQVEQFTVQAPASGLVKPVDMRGLNQQCAVRYADAGPSELDVQLPVSGKLFQFEKMLVVRDQQWFSYRYKNLTK